jgi:hypothetical protein
MLRLVFLQLVSYTIEFRSKEYSTLDKELFIRKPIGNEELIKEIRRLIES